MAGPRIDSLAEFVEYTAASLIDAQRLLDAELDAALCRDVEQLDEIPTEWLDVVMPPVVRVQTMEASLRLEMTAEREVGANVSLQLRGRPVTSFAEARFGTSSTQGVEIQLTAVATAPFAGVPK